MTTSRIHVHIDGRVQGVGFRYWTHRRALDLGLTGWVRNGPGGQVEAVFEGDRLSVERMANECHQGPPGAWVRDVQCDWEHDVPPQHHGFSVRY